MKVLPALRSDLEFFSAPTALDGSPEYTLHDPVSGTYLRIGWAEATLFTHWRGGMAFERFLETLRTQTTLRPTTEDIDRFIGLAERHALTVGRSAKEIESEAETKRIGPFQWLLHHYLYIRIPLVRPDGFLKATLPGVRWLAARTMWILYSLLTLIGIGFLIGRWEIYLATFPHFLNGTGALAYGIVIVVIKTLHELSHAYTARAQGVRVRSMGIVFFVLWPIPYTDVTDAWRLKSRKKRLAIGFAGIALELVLAGLSLLGWALTPPGLLRSLFFLVSSVTLISTLIANLNPAMRFDGYYLLSDLWGIDNLRQRAFDATRWALRRFFLGLRCDPPEPLPARRLAGMIVYSILAWMYRLVIYISIALLVYHFFIKALGIVLFLLEIWYFILRPIYTEWRTLVRLRSLWLYRFPSLVTGTVLAILALWLIIPSSGTVTIAAIIDPQTSQTLYAPTDGTVVSTKARRNAVVKPGQVLLILENRALETRLEILRREISVLKIKRDIARSDEKRKAVLPEILEALAKSTAQLRAAEEEKTDFTLRARIGGTLLEWDNRVVEGVHLRADTVMGRIADLQSKRLVAYVEESDLNNLSLGDPVTFYPTHGTVQKSGTVVSISPTRIATLPHRALSSESRGDIAVVGAPDGSLVPIQAYYEVQIDLEHPQSAFGQSGRVAFKTPPRSRLLSGIQALWRVWLRESTF